MSNKYDTDIQEIVSFISCIKSEKAEPACDGCVKAFTQKTGEAFLDERADEVRNAISSDPKIRTAFELLASVCEGQYTSDCEECLVRNYCNSFILYKRAHIDKKRCMVDLFCGAGGLSLGFVQEGFYAALANDIEACCVDTYAHNHPETPRDHIIQGDIRDVVADLEQLMEGKTVDVVVGGPPCQGFSTANRQRLIDDPRNYLYKNYIEVVKKLQPKFFVMENVKGMLGVSDQVKEDFENIGYTVECKVFNAKDFGVPQNRERLIYVGNRMGIDNKMLIDEIDGISAESNKHLLKDALEGLRPLQASRKRNATEEDSETSGCKIEPASGENDNDYITRINEGRTVLATCNHKARYNNDRDIEIFGRLNQGDKSDDPKIADIMPYKRRSNIFKDKYFKLEENKICKTITAHMKFDCNMYIHPTQARGLTPREAARVQSYPDDYFFRGAYTKTYMQIGNSVPPILGRAIATVIKKHIDD